MIAEHWGAVMALGIIGLRIGVAFAQNFRDKMRNGYKRVTLSKQVSAACPRTRAFCQMPAENNLWAHARKPGRKNSGPIIAAMARVNDLNALRADESRRFQDQRKLQWTDREWVKSNSKLLRDLGKLTARRASEPNGVTKLRERVRDSDRSIIRPSTCEHRIQVENRKRHHIDFFTSRVSGGLRWR